MSKIRPEIEGCRWDFVPYQGIRAARDHHSNVGGRRVTGSAAILPASAFAVVPIRPRPRRNTRICCSVSTATRRSLSPPWGGVGGGGGGARG
nr:unnamed protein product [Digitaria exilis]